MSGLIRVKFKASNEYCDDGYVMYEIALKICDRKYVNTLRFKDSNTLESHMNLCEHLEVAFSDLLESAVYDFFNSFNKENKTLKE